MFNIFSFFKKNKIEKENKYTPIRYSLEAIRYGDRDLFDILGENVKYNLTQDVLEEFIEDSFKLKHYQEIKNNFYRKMDELNQNVLFEKDYIHFLCEDKVGRFLNALTSEFLYRKGEIRNFDDACHIASKLWIEKIFGKEKLDNGDYSFRGNINAEIGTYVKNQLTTLYNQKEIIEKLQKLLFDYYQKGSMYENIKLFLYSDYGPNHPLFDMLVKSGIDKKDAESITPWKTGIHIDENDNSVVLRTYQKLEYI